MRIKNVELRRPVAIVLKPRVLDLSSNLNRTVSGWLSG